MLLCTYALSGCATTYNPATGREEFIAISTSQEVAMGQDVHQQLSGQYKFLLYTDQAIRLRRIAAGLASVSDRQDYQYHFYLIDKNEMNAFTTPGGNIYVFNGLMEKLKTDEEVASVIAHEIGHCAAKHTVKKFQAALGYRLIGNIVLSQLGEQARSITEMSSGFVMNLVFSAYSRQDELEADRLAVKYMRKAGHDPWGMIKTFEVLQKESKGADAPSLFRTHPHVRQRIEAAKREIQKNP